MRRWTASCIAMLCLLVATRGAIAQQLRGVARDSATSAALPGVVVSVIGSAGDTLSRAIADGNGRFSVTFPARAARLRAIRIGYRPREITVAAGSSTVEFVMGRLPPILDAVRVSDRELCPGSTDRGASFQLWEQARAGLLAAVVAREANPANATTLVYERRTLANDALIRRQRVDVHGGETTRPFVAFATPASFVTSGYLREDGGDRLFLAPDADILLDESFAATHCFHLQAADTAHVNQIGLAFAPVPGRPDSLVDVNGVIWIDRANPEVRSFDFLYTGLEPAATRANAGGHLEFRTMANGVSFIERWSLLLPVLAVVPRPAASTTDPFPRPPRRRDRRDLRVEEIQEAGGQVLQATWKDGTTWRDEPTGVTGVVMQSGKPLVHAIVTLAGTSDTSFTDERGLFTMVPLVPGRYSIVAVDTVFAAFTPPRSDAQIVDVRRGRVSALRVRLTTAFEAITRICRAQQLLPNTTTITGRVLFSDGSLPVNAVVRAVWQADYSQDANGGVSVHSSERSMNLDSEGRFLLCGIAPERPVHLTLLHKSGTADTTITSYEPLLKAVEWRAVLRPPDH